MRPRIPGREESCRAGAPRGREIRKEVKLKKIIPGWKEIGRRPHAHAHARARTHAHTRARAWKMPCLLPRLFRRVRLWVGSG